MKMKLKDFFDSEEIGKYRINLAFLYNFSYTYIQKIIRIKSWIKAGLINVQFE